MKTPVSIIIPTFSNPQFLNPCVTSIIQSGALHGLCELVIVNNGKQPVQEFVNGWPNTRVLEPGKNLGWEGGLQYGIDNTDSPFLVFQNDDTQIPYANAKFYHILLNHFNDESVAAVGPATTVAAGWHSVRRPIPLIEPTEVSYLIFFTVMVRREHLILVGGIDTTCPGGDDMDLSIRFRKAGKKLVLEPRAFLEHHAFKTGERVRGTSDKAMGWNSKEMTDRTNQWLIQKHGFKTFMETMRGLSPMKVPGKDTEGAAIRSLVKEGTVLELGCGATKTVPHSVGVDRVPKGEMIPHIGKESVADIVSDVSEQLPVNDCSYDNVIARHILEHSLDSIKTLKEWNRVLKVGGQLVVAVPNENVGKGIPMNPEHVHAFKPESLKTLMELCGFKEAQVVDPKNGISFVGFYEKVFHVGKIQNGQALETVNA